MIVPSPILALRCASRFAAFIALIAPNVPGAMERCIIPAEVAGRLVSVDDGRAKS